MSESNVPARKKTNRIEEHGLEEAAVKFLTASPRMSYGEIAEQLTEIAGLQDSVDPITARVVSNYAKTYPEVRREILLANREMRRNLVLEGAEFDMLRTLKDMAARLTFMIDTMEEIALDEGMIPNPRDYKALVSELREVMKQIEDIHKSVYDMEVVRKFLIDVVNTLKEVSPQSLEAFIMKMKGKRDNDHIVSEILKGR